MFVLSAVSIKPDKIISTGLCFHSLKTKDVFSGIVAFFIKNINIEEEINMWNLTYPFNLNYIANSKPFSSPNCANFPNTPSLMRSKFLIFPQQDGRTREHKQTNEGGAAHKYAVIVK